VFSLFWPVWVTLASPVSDAGTGVIEATVHADLRTIEGVLTLSDDLDTRLVDPLALLPEPEDDRTLFRTYPGAPHHGRVDFERQPDGRWSFRAHLPRRFGATGATRHGLFANGAWYPQPVTEAAVTEALPPDWGIPVVDWEVTLTLPERATGALGDQVGGGTLTWSGRAERVPLAVTRRGVLTEIGSDDARLSCLTRGKPRRVLVTELTKQLAIAAEHSPALEGACVEAPLRRRLVRSGPGLAYVSDRAFRLTPPLQRFHRVAVTRGVLQSLLPEPDPFLRELQAAEISTAHADALKGADADTLLRKLQWLPSINILLSSRRMPFYSEILELPHPGDPLRDDLLEILDPHTPGTVVMAQLQDTFGPQARIETAPEAWLSAWRVPYPEQDYLLEVDKRAQTATVTRIAPADAPSETVVLSIDGERHTWVAGSPDPEDPTSDPDDQHTFSLPEEARRITLDPDRHLGQLSRVGDAWPQRYQVTLAMGVSTINLTQLRLLGAGWMTLRKQDDTRNLWIGSIYNGFNDLVGTRLRYLRKAGPLQDGYSRPHVFGVAVENSVLNPRFAETDGFKLGVGGSLSYAWDTRISGHFPLRGQRIGVYGGGGYVPGTDAFWSDAGARAVGVVSPHPRHALAAETSVAVARSSVAHRLLSMGGAGAMTSLPALPACPNPDEDGNRQPCQVLATQRALIATEYRWAPLRNASVPMLLAWGNELQLSGGLEAIAARVRGEPAYAAGVTAGISGVGDILGADPTLMGVTLGWPLWWQGIRDPDRTPFPGTNVPLPEIYLRWSQAF